ncbi:MAG: OsmC family protein [Ktedonobacterales bacterium]
MATTGEATGVLIGPMAFDVVSGSGHTLRLDVNAADGGEDSGPTPMELLLMALAGCTGMDVISILRKKRQDVRAYTVHVHGTRAEDHPRVYTEITVEHVLTGHNLSEAAVARALELSDTKYCGVELTLNKTAHVTTSYQIIESDA